MSKAIGLIRVSSKKQDLDQQSVKVKEAILNDGFSENDIILIEDKESGYKLSEEERSGINKLKSIIESEQVSSVYVYEISRISRQAKIVFSVRDYLFQRKINLICLNPYFKLLEEDGSQSSTSSIIFGIFASLSEQESYLRIQRVTRGIAKKKSEGKVMGRVMIYGYTRVNGEPKVVDNQAVIIREIFDRFERGESCGSIGKDMYLIGVFGSDIKRNSVVCRVSCILSEERYSGAVWPFPGIISKAQFDKCRKIIHDHNKKFARVHYTDKDYYCTGVLYTDRGFAMSSSYGNRRYQYRDPDKVYSLNVNMNILDKLTLYALKKYLDSGVSIVEKEKEIKEVSYKIDVIDQKKKEIKLKIKKLREDNDMIENRIIKKRISEAKGDEMIDSNNLEIKHLEDSFDDLEYERGIHVNRLIYLNSFLSEDESSSFIASTPDDIRFNIRKYIDRIVVSRLSFGKFKIKYIFKDKVEKEYGFYSIVHKCEYYDSDGKVIQI